MPHREYDAVVVGSGPNGLAAAIALAKAGLSVAIFEGSNTIGGGMRSSFLTLPGFIHDVCSAIHPLALGSPFFRKLPLEHFGLEWIHPDLPLAHPFDDGTCAVLDKSLEKTSDSLDPKDRDQYLMLFKPLVENWDLIANDLLGPFRFPENLIPMLKFALRAVRSARSLAKSRFEGERARGLFAGLAAHSIQPLDRPLTAAFGLLLGILGHRFGWPMPKGGSQKIADALGGYFRSLGGKIFTDSKVCALSELPSAAAIFLDVTPRQALTLAGANFPTSYSKKLQRFRFGPGVFKIDWALSGPIPWKAEPCRRAGTVHIGGGLDEISVGEKQVWQGIHPEKPYVLVAQQSLFDPSRVPEGKESAWAYCHVPNNSTQDMTPQIEDQMERFAPGFKDTILAKSSRLASEFEAYNPNCIGGDITGGVQDIWQLFTRPAGLFEPYATPNSGIFFCSSSTPPGGGVHGMCGYHAARCALKRLFGQDLSKYL